ncbi:hypothetical protein F2Q69_00052801 [Brassica cretica]|uniref:Replication protein A 70 kDa DNA-binding subunit B/D first OB fold domain-containing protein n=1 Tax=Brassica cretica TaxID=69181 RepID=A0A8S9N2N9_BRACR|nr:hypothetical protein F2Q69_00052801 [Brassica cretica]
MSIAARSILYYVLVSLASSKTQKVRVKVIDKWTLYNFRAGNSIEFVIVEETDTRLHTFIENGLVQNHKHLLNEGKTLSINTFSLKEYGGQFITNLFPYKLAILRTIKTRALTDFPNSVQKKYFTDFGEY